MRESGAEAYGGLLDADKALKSAAFGGLFMGNYDGGPIVIPALQAGKLS